MNDSDYFEDCRNSQSGFDKWRTSTNEVRFRNQIKSLTSFIQPEDTFSSLSSQSQYKDNKYVTLMTELYSIFDKSIDDNPQTKRNFDGTVDEPVIRDLCLGFKKSIEEIAAKYKIQNYCCSLWPRKNSIVWRRYKKWTK